MQHVRQRERRDHQGAASRRDQADEDDDGEPHALDLAAAGPPETRGAVSPLTGRRPSDPEQLDVEVTRMMKELDLAAASLVIVGGLNALSVAAGKFDLVSAMTGKKGRHGGMNIATRVVYGVIGGGALWSLSRLIEREAFSS
ncbi:MAG TPA: DUF378 domain-containing protein [Gaiellaceae bacterium]